MSRLIDYLGDGCRIAGFVRLAGVILFVISFFVPNADRTENGLVWSESCVGLSAFLITPVMLAKLLGAGGDWRTFIAGAALAAGWLANFTVFFRVPAAFAWALMSIPWLLFLAFRCGWYPGGTFITGFLPFYLWAASIVLIHGL